MKLSILMPVYNESATVMEAVKSALDVDYPCDVVELVVVDDGSSDATPTLLADIDDTRVLVHHHRSNRGKGAAIRTAAALATGDYMVIYDADLEYSAPDIPGLLRPVLEGDAEVVYGSRTFGSQTAFSFWYLLGGRATTMLANALYNCWISDMHTCLKVMPLPLFRQINPTADGFGMDTEVTARLLHLGIRPREVPITYRARTRHAGKKLTWRDGIEAVWILLKVRTSGRRSDVVRRAGPR